MRAGVRTIAAVAALLGGAAALGLAALLGAARGPVAPPPEGGLLVPVDPETLARVDLGQVHEELIPAWVGSSGGVQELHFDRLRRAVAADAGLTALVGRMGALVRAGPAVHGPELDALTHAWNEVMARADQPHRLGSEIEVGAGSGRFVLKTYRVIADDATAVVDGHPYPIEIRRRVDALGATDRWLGAMHTHEDGVAVLLDRVTTFSLDGLWPILDPALPRTPLQEAFAPALRAELARQLDEGQLSALRATAADRVAMTSAVADVHARHACGASFAVTRLPWNGFDARELAVFQSNATGPDDPCPDVRRDEAMLFAERSWHLRDTPGVREALERLVAVVAGGVAVHEARHAADDRSLDGQRIPCIGCPPDTSHVGALEASAYLASFADPQHGVVSLFQACAVDAALGADRVGTISFLAGRLVEGGCGAAPPADLAERARALERELFLRSDAVRLEGFPASLPVSSEYRNR